MAPNLLFYQLLVVALVLICLLIHGWWPDQLLPQPPLASHKRRRQRSKEPIPFTGFLHTPLCAAGEQEADERPKAPGSPPPVLPFTRGRRRMVDTHAHVCPEPDGSYQGGRGRGNLRANGQPGGQPWRQLQCVCCQRYFCDTHGTLLHGKRSSPELIVRVIAWLAAGLGIRGTARVCEIDPHTVRSWLVEAAEQLRAFWAYFLHEVPITQGQLDALYAVRCAVRDGDVSEAEAVEQLSRSPHWGWTAIAPETKRLLSVQGGERTLAIAQAMLHQTTPLVAPGCVPRFVSDGNPHSLPALGAHCGRWGQPPQRPAMGPLPSRGGCPCPRCCTPRSSKP